MSAEPLEAETACKGPNAAIDGEAPLGSQSFIQLTRLHAQDPQLIANKRTHPWNEVSLSAINAGSWAYRRDSWMRDWEGRGSPIAPLGPIQRKFYESVRVLVEHISHVSLQMKTLQQIKLTLACSLCLYWFLLGHLSSSITSLVLKF